MSAKNQIRPVLYEAKIDAIFSKLDSSHLPGAAVGIAVDGIPVYRKGFGLASLELPLLLSPTIRMRLGSTTKHFTCLALMLLCEDGLADLNDPVGSVLPELHEVNRQATFQQLMTNTSGLRDAFDIIWQFSGDDAGAPISSCQILECYKSISDTNSAPGNSWRYNNGGFLLLTAAIERLTGKSLEVVLRERIFEPLGMNDTALRRRDEIYFPNSASMHSFNSQGQYCRAPARTDLSGEGGLVSTVDDMLRWLAHMDRPKIGSAETWARLLAAHTLPNGALTGYGMGTMLESYRDIDFVHHPGSVSGGNAQMVKVPSAKLDIVILINRRDVWAAELAYQVLDACLPQLEHAETVQPGPLIDGVFCSRDAKRVVQFFRARSDESSLAPGSNQFAFLDGCEVPVSYTKVGRLAPSGMYTFMKSELELLGDPSEPEEIRLHEYGNEVALHRVERAKQSDGDLVQGTYAAPSIGVDLVIRKKSSGLEAVSTGRFGGQSYSLEPLANSVWRLRYNGEIPWGGVLSADKTFNKLFFSSAARTVAVPFHRVA